MFETSVLMAGAPFASPPFKEVLLRSEASWSTAVVADILSKSDAVKMSVLFAQVLDLKSERMNVQGNFAFALKKRNSYRTLLRRDVFDERV
jgi:hypothetical protein